MKYSLGLGIDTGGTFTDAVLFDFTKNRVLSKAKSNTTPWRYSEGIMNSISSLPQEDLLKIDIVSLSTTLVTNAIVESKTQPVGLLLMPPGTFEPENIKNTPSKIVKGRISIDGSVTEPVDPVEIKLIVKSMILNQKVQAFAVSSYGGSVNPQLELDVKKIIREETGLDVCCGHELSGTLNYYVRANTAVLNAGTIPVMEVFLSEMKTALTKIGIKAPVMVVRGDGSVMSHKFAQEFPIQTALSGPAASMAGAKYLTGITNALVVDVGGTTSDIGILEDNRVGLCSDGAEIGSWKTHVEAVDMHTAGLGGDSEITFDRSVWKVGPRRIIPFCYMTSLYNNSGILEYVESRIDDTWENTKSFQWLYLSGKDPDFTISNQEKKILQTLHGGPLILPVISDLIGAGDWKLIRSERLEQAGCVLRSGFTPTDLYHAEGKLHLWSAKDSLVYLNAIARCADIGIEELKENLNNIISNTMGTVFFGRIFSDISGRSELIDPILQNGNRYMILSPELKIPVIGLGASASLILSNTVEHLNGKLILPEHGDVANAVGAVTSKVSVTLSISIVPTPLETYRFIGSIKGSNSFDTLEDAEIKCLEELKERTIILAKKSGTSEKQVSISTITRTALGVSGNIIFLERIFTSHIEGKPDLI